MKFNVIVTYHENKPQTIGDIETPEFESEKEFLLFVKKFARENGGKDEMHK